MNQYKIDFSAVEWESPIPGVRHQARALSDVVRAIFVEKA